MLILTHTQLLQKHHQTCIIDKMQSHLESNLCMFLEVSKQGGRPGLFLLNAGALPEPLKTKTKESVLMQSKKQHSSLFFFVHCFILQGFFFCLSCHGSHLSRLWAKERLSNSSSQINGTISSLSTKHTVGLRNKDTDIRPNRLFLSIGGENITQLKLPMASSASRAAGESTM